MALVLHPDKNKAPGSDKAFQTLKKAFDVIMSGVDPEAPDTTGVCTFHPYKSDVFLR